MNAKDNSFKQPSQEGDDIAIIGMSCRYPGGSKNPDDFYKFLLNNGNGIIDVPQDRWDNNAYYDPDKEKPNRMYVNRGGFLSNIDQFDPMFFGIPPKEAQFIDPQHRWLLEITYEAFENAGIRPSNIRGSNTAVFIGQFMHDYEQLLLDSSAHKLITSHSATGPSMTLTANRISYLFDLIGPSVTLDTACSSSLVALDLACRAIRSGDSEMALAGGVNILLRPELTMSIAAASMLSPDCLCKSFDASANGYVRSEGAGVVLVKKLSAALKDNDPIIAIVKATGTNQDGQTQGITVPNGASQQKLLAASLKKADIAPETIQYAEAHGTGTAVGDPIEVNALGELLGQRPEGSPQCIIGSVKSNVGHMESAAGMAGLMKTVLAMKNGIIPNNIHYNETNPAIDLDKLNVRILTEPESWPKQADTPRRAIVNSFGFGGTNANAIIEEAPPQVFREQTRSPVVNHGAYLLPISAKNQQSVADLAEKYRSFFAELDNNVTTEQIHDICFTASVRRDHYKYRVAISGSCASDFVARLTEFKEGTANTDVYSGTQSITSKDNINCFVFAGMGTQWAGAGKELYDNEPVFRDALNKCNDALQKYSGWSLIEALYNTESTLDVDQTDIAQPIIFAIQVALFDLLKSWGVVPDMIVGHSAGEVAAALCAGALCFDDAIKVIYHRSHLQQTTAGMGKMLAVGVEEKGLPKLLASYSDRVSVAAVNSEDAITIAGDADALEDIAAKLDNDGVFARFLKVSVPFHSPVMDRLKQPIINELQGITVHPPKIPIYSTVSGELADANSWAPAYWADNVREPVKFKTAIENILGAGATSFIELAPHSALASSVTKIITKTGKTGVSVTALRRERSAIETTQQMLAELYIAGALDDWNPLYPNGGNVASLPNYAWQHASYWCEAEEVRNARLNNVLGRSAFGAKQHELLGGKLASASHVWQNALDLSETSYIADHRIGGDVIYPGAGYIEMALAAAKSLNTESETQCITLEDFEFHRALYLTEQGDTQLETEYRLANNALTIRAQDNNTNEWILHGSTRVRFNPMPSTPKVFDIQNIQETYPNAMNKNEFYDYAAQLGLTYQGEFQTLQYAWIDGWNALAKIEVSDAVFKESDTYHLHPALLDGAFQTFFATTDIGYLPVNINTLNYYEKPPKQVYCYFETLEKTPTYGRGNLTICNEQGRVLIEIFDFEVNAIIDESHSASTSKQLAYDFQWLQEELPEEKVRITPERHWILVTNGDSCVTDVASCLKDSGNKVVIIEFGSADYIVEKDHLCINTGNPESISNALRSYANENTTLIYIAGTEQVLFDSAEADQVQERCHTLAMNAVLLAQAYDTIAWKTAPEIIYLTQNAQTPTLTPSKTNPIHGSLWGLARVYASEHPEIIIRLIDLEEIISDQVKHSLVCELFSDVYEQEVALRGNSRYTNRLQALSADKLISHTLQPKVYSQSEDFEVCTATTSQYLRLIPSSIKQPERGEIQVRIEASYSSNSHFLSKQDGNQDLAFISVGRIIALGSDVPQYEIDDQVLVIGHDRLQASLNTPIDNCVRVNISETPSTFLINAVAKLEANFIFQLLPRATRGDAIYIHDATSDCGLALVFKAIESGLEVLAGVDTEADLKRLHNIGVKESFLIEDLKYQPQLLSNSHQNNFAIVISNHCGELPPRIEQKMTPMGTIVRLGTQVNSQYETAPRRNISEIRASLLQLLLYRPQTCREILQNQVDLKEPATALPRTSVYRADCLIQSDHGDQRVTSDPCIIEFAANEHQGIEGKNPAIVKPGYSYLVTGGLGGLGLQIMEWLAEKGASSIVLIGRSDPKEQALQQIAAVKAKGITVTIKKADVTVGDDVMRVVREISDELPPLRGVIHSAGVLDDGVIATQSAASFEKVLAPKVRGTWNLHSCTIHLDIDLFVCFSSIASVVGWAGQSNYATGNAFMDSFAAYRAALGLPCLSINWGPWAEAGMAANLADIDIKRMNDAGMFALQPDMAFQAMESLLEHRLSQAGIFDLEWDKIGKQLAAPERKTLFKNLISWDELPEKSQFIEQLHKASDDIRETLLVNKCREILADILGIQDPNVIATNTNLFEYGVNSLMAMDFKNKLQAVVKTKLPASLLPKNPTIEGMVGALICILNDATNVPVDATQRQFTGRAEMTVAQKQHVYGVIDPAWGFACYYFETDIEYDTEKLNQAVLSVVNHHDALRSSFIKEGEQWHLEYKAVSELSVVKRHNWQHISDLERIDERLGEYCRQIVEQAELDHPPLFTVDIFEMGGDHDYILLLSMHHLCFDGFSKEFILQDLQTAYEQIAAGVPVELPPQTTPLSQYTAAISEHVNSAEVTEEVDYWLSLPWEKVKALPVDYPNDDTQGKFSTQTRFVGKLSAQDTDKLLRKTTLKLNCQVMDLFTTAYSLLAKSWLGSDVVAFRVFDSGREIVSYREDIDVSRTVGWVSILNTTLITLPEGSLSEIVRSVTAQRKKHPNKGLHPQLLQEYHKDETVVERIQSLPEPGIWINYFSNPMKYTDKQIHEVQSHSYLNPENISKWKLFLLINSDSDELNIEWQYSSELFNESTVKWLNDTFVSILLDINAACELREASTTETETY